MFNHVMVPLDGSELADRALPYAERIAAATGATLHLVTVVEPLAHLAWASTPVYLSPQDYAEATSQATAYLEARRTRLGTANTRVETLAGVIAPALLDYERESRIDLAVICSHGRGGFRRLLLGSVAGQLIQLGAAPVLVVPAHGAVTLPDHAIVPLDGSPRAEEALPVVRALAPGAIREVTLLRVAEGVEPAEATAYLEHIALRLRLEQPALVVHQRLEQGNPVEAIIACVGTDRLAVMTTHGRSDLTRWALGSVADRVAHGSGAPVLLVRRPGHPARQA